VATILKRGISENAAFYHVSRDIEKEEGHNKDGAECLTPCGRHSICFFDASACSTVSLPIRLSQGPVGFAR